MGDVVRLAMLGPVEARSGQQRLDLGGPKPRLILSLLAVDAGRVLPTDRLVTAVWEGDVPADPRAALQVNISNLRRALADGVEGRDAARAPARIEHEAGGYVLCIDRGAVDLHRFQRLVSEGADLVPTDPQRAATVLRDALTLWRGRPFGDLADEPALVPEVQRLEELRLRAVERRIAADLDLGEHARVVEELATLVDAHPLREPFWAQLALARYRSGRQAESLQAYERLRSVLAEELGADPSPALQDLHARILRQDPTLDAATRPASVPAGVGDGGRRRQHPAADTRNPYKGLRAFREDDHRDFFGRDRLIANLVDGVEQHHLLALVGPSGSGKSSVARAGLIPALRAKSQASEQSWVVATMTPGEWPMAELERTLERVAGGSGEEVGRVLATEEGGLGSAAELVLGDHGRLLLLVDQFEEVFALARAADRSAFLDQLRSAAVGPDGRVTVVLTLRADFYDQLLLDPGLGPVVADRTVPVSPLSAEEVERAITRPAEAVGLQVEPELVAAMVADVVDAPGSLPLLQYALTELCDARDGHILRLDDYREIGGLRGALAGRADELYEDLDGEARQVCRQLFLRLVAVTEDVIETRRRVLRNQLATLGPPDVVDGVLETYGRHRFLTFDRDPFSGAPTVEIAHEALTRAWGRFRGWIDAARDDLIMHRRLLVASDEWRLGGRDESYLLRGARLEQTLEWSETSSVRLAEEEQRYLDESVRIRDERLEEQRRREQREADLERRSIRRLRGLVAVLVVGIVAAVVLSAFAWQQRDRARGQEAVAEQQRAIAEAQQRVATARELAAAAIAELDTDPERSILLAVEAVETTRTADGTVLPEAETALHRALLVSRVEAVHDTGAAVAVSADGSVALVGMDGLLEVRGPEGDVRWQADGRPTHPLMTDPAGNVPLSFVGRTPDVSFDPSGERLATADRSFTVEIRDAVTGEVLATLDRPAIRPVFSPDGRTVAALLPGADNDRPWGAGRTLGLWDATTGELLRRFEGHDTNILDHAFSPDGTRLASAAPNAGTVRIWDVATGEQVAVVDRALAKAVAYSPDGSQLATAAGDGLAEVRDAETLEELAVFRGHDGDLFGVAFSPDGSVVAVAGSGAELFDPVTGAEILRLTGHRGVIADVAFTPDGRGVLTSAEDDTTRLWNVADRGGVEFTNLPGPPSPARGALAFSPAGGHLAAAGPDGLRIYDTTTWDVVRTLRPVPPAVTEVVFSPDGSQVAAGLFAPPTGPGVEGVLAVWEFASGELVTTAPGHGGIILDLAFSPDGDRIATGTDDEGMARVFDVGDTAPVSTYHLEEGSVVAVEFTEAGLFVGGQDAGYLIDPDTGEERRAFDEVDETIVDDRLTPDGELVTADIAGRVQVWDPASGQLLRTLRRAPGGGIGAVAVHGGLVASAAPVGVVVSALDSGAVRFELDDAGHDGPVVDLGFSLDGSYLATTGSDGTVRVFLVPVEDLVDLARRRVTRDLTEDECRRFLHQDSC